MTTARTEAPISPDVTSHRFQDLGPLGSGGMGTVRRVWDRLLDRMVALKRAHVPTRAATSAAAAPLDPRLAEEFALLARLEHPGIVRVLDLGPAPEAEGLTGAFWLTSELVEGPRLDRWLAGRPAPRAVLAAVTELVQTLAWLHAQGLVHGDLKPANILMAPRPTLIDFGLAGAIGAPFLGGTRAYLEPALADGTRETLGPGTDLYALGRSLEPWVGAVPELAAWTEALLRAESAAEVLEQLAPASADGPARPGPRPLAPSVWAEAEAEACARALATPRTLVQLPPEAEVERFAAALAAHLGLARHETWVLPAGTDALTAWARVVTAATGAGPEVPPVASPDDQKEALDAFVDAAIAALKRPGALRPRVIVPAPERLGTAGRFVLARLVEANALAGCTLVAARDAAWTLERGALASFEVVAIPPLERAQLEALIAAEGLSDQAAAEALWRRLSPVGEAAARVLLGLGGEALPAALTALGAPARGLTELAELRLLTRGAGGRTALTTALQAALREGRLALAPLTDSERERWVAQLAGESEPSAAGQRARAAHLMALGRAEEAAIAWEDAAQAAQRAFRWDQAAEAWRAAAEAWWTAGPSEPNSPSSASRASNVVTACKAGLAAARASGGGPTVAALLGLLETALPALGTAAQAEALLARARARLDLGSPAEALAALAGWPPAGTTPTMPAAFEAALVRGTALARTERPGEARVALAEALRLAEALGDQHALGRVANNLGIAAFHEGDLAAAADAWARAAAAKAMMGDRRGQRIGLFNRALALRELGQFAAATQLVDEAEALAEAIGDRVGEATAALARAQLALDLGSLSRADAALARADAVPWKPAFVEGDRAIVALRLAIARGDLAEARRLATEAMAFAAAHQLRPVTAEAWAIGVAVGLRDGAFDTPVQAEGGLQALVLGARALLHAGSGKWGEARRDLDAFLALAGDDPAHPEAGLAPVAVAGIAPAWEAAQIIGVPVEGLGRIAARIIAVRAQAAQTAHGLGAADPETIACALGLQALLPSLRKLTEGAARSLHNAAAQGHAARAAHSDETTMRPLDSFVYALLAQLPTARPSSDARPADLSSAAAWARIVRRAAGADHCELWIVEGAAASGERAPEASTGPIEIAVEPFGVSRFGRVAAKFASTPAASGKAGSKAVPSDLAPFVVRRPESEGGRFEAVGVPIVCTPTIRGAVFLAWDAGDAASAPEVPPMDLATFEPIARLTALPLLLALEKRRAGLLEADVKALESQHEAEVTALRDALERSQTALELRYDYKTIVHRSPGMRRVLETLDKVTDRDLPVLLLGESGVGKELLARALHVNGPRKGKRFVAENCGAIPRDLFESHFFGHVKGAFTGATNPRQGLFEIADGGTIFLDEIGELPLEHQVKLLRVLQERRVRAVGGSRDVPVDFRLVTATNRDLQQMVADGRFREDLYYRVAVVPLKIPPLRERRDDIVPLAEHFLDLHTARGGGHGGHGGPAHPRPRLSPEVADRLANYAWPGNVRELENEIMRILALCDGDTVKPRHLSFEIQRASPAASHSAPRAEGKRAGHEPLETTLARVEREALIAALTATNGQKLGAAKRLGLSRPGLDAKLARHGIEAKSLKKRDG